jgi:RNA polymerase sigma factor (sigma-70 family)
MENNTEKKSIVDTYIEIKSSLMRFAFRYLKSQNDIEDVVQEAFVRAVNAEKKTEITHIKSYIFMTVKNLSLKKLDKSEFKLADSVGDFCEEGIYIDTQTLEEQFESNQRFELFCKAIRMLPVKCQQVYILRKVYGYSQKEIAQRMNISIKTVESHLTKAIVRCTDYMEEYENANSAVQEKQKNTTVKI